MLYCIQATLVQCSLQLEYVCQFLATDAHYSGLRNIKKIPRDSRYFRVRAWTLGLLKVNPVLISS